MNSVQMGAALDAAGLAEVPITEIASEGWDSPTQRPAFSVLENRRWAALGHALLRPWQKAVAEYVKSYLLQGDNSSDIMARDLQ